MNQPSINVNGTEYARASDLAHHKDAIARQRDRLVTAMSLEGTNQSLDSAVSIAISRLGSATALIGHDAKVRHTLIEALDLKRSVDSTADLAKRLHGLCEQRRRDNIELARAPGEAREALAKALGISPQASSLEGLLRLVTDRIKNDASIIRGQQDRIRLQAGAIDTLVVANERLVHEVRTLKDANERLAGEVHRLCAVTGQPVMLGQVADHTPKRPLTFWFDDSIAGAVIAPAENG